MSYRISMGAWHPKENTFALARHNSLFIYTEKRSSTMGSSDKKMRAEWAWSSDFAQYSWTFATDISCKVISKWMIVVSHTYILYMFQINPYNSLNAATNAEYKNLL